MERNVSKGIGGESVGGCMTTCVTGFVLEGVLCCGVVWRCVYSVVVMIV